MKQKINNVLAAAALAVIIPAQAQSTTGAELLALMGGTPAEQGDAQAYIERVALIATDRLICGAPALSGEQLMTMTYNSLKLNPGYHNQRAHVFVLAELYQKWPCQYPSSKGVE